jgi:arsenite methyltransferase
MSTNSDQSVIENVKDYYGKELKSSQDLKTNACCTAEAVPSFVKPILKDIHVEVSSKYYGCGLVLPEELEGLRVLDLGSGSGRDVYLLSKLVGETGEVVGVDMTDEQLDVAREYQEYHREKYGYQKSNVKFLKGDIQKLEELGLEENSFDLIISNCVINLVPNKEQVLNELYRCLKPGGEFYFSDVYSDRRIPKSLQEDKVLWGECLSGALYRYDFQEIAKKTGFLDPRIVKASNLDIHNKEVEEKTKGFKFYSITYRLFKLPELEYQCEDYGQSVVYKGTIPHYEETFTLDQKHVINKGEDFKVCGNTYAMLHDTRFQKHFEFKGDFKNHLGRFEECYDSSEDFISGGSCC